MARRTGHLTAVACVAVCAAAAVAPWAASAAPSATDPGWNWAVPAIRDMVARHGWPAGDQTRLGRLATRRELARGLAEILRNRGEAPPAGLRRPPDVAASDPDATAIAWVSSTRLLTFATNVTMYPSRSRNRLSSEKTTKGRAFPTWMRP